MRLLFTGDWQLSFMNLDKAKVMIKEIISICKEKQVDMVINLGDMKEVYNPIDVRVANFGVWACGELKKRNIAHILILGNHDRVGMYSDSQNWLPILAEAGALTYDKPEVVSLDGKVHLHILPFMTDKDKLKAAAKQLAEEADEHSILAFHEDVQGCKYNLMAKSESKFRAKDLYPAMYQFCIGGHIHLQQKIKDNIWYAGSPFAMDWGEANQRKGYLLVDTEKGKIFPIYSSIPRLYDPLWPGFDQAKPKSWTGAEVRIHVPYDNSVHDLQSLITKARLRAQRDYPGAQIVPIAEYVSDDKVNTWLDEDSSDEEHVAEYVRQTCWDNLLIDRSKIVKYMVSRLKAVGISARQNTRVEFIRARGINFGSFKDIELDFTRHGITMLLGKNEDWKNRSNGSGKTTALQIPAVALFGQTFKGQKHDRWARRGSLKKAMAIVELKTADGTRVKVIRCRRPHRLKLLVWSGTKWRDKSSGNKKEETQSLIEKTIGFTWQTLANAIYVDQDRINALLAGTDGERKKLLEQFQNLERYHEAQEKVKVDLRKLEASIQDTDAEINGALAAIKSIEEAMDSLDDSNYDALKKEYQEAKDALTKAKESSGPKLKKLNKVLDAQIGEREKQESFLSVAVEGRSYWNSKIELLEKQVAKAKKLIGAVCPTCNQRVDRQDIKQHVEEMEEEIKQFERKLDNVNAEGDEAQQALRTLDEKIKGLEETKDTVEDIIRKLERIANERFANYRSLKAVKEARKEMGQKVVALQKKLDIWREDIANKRTDLVFYEYCVEAFSRKGLPAFLNALLCPKLNRASEYYSKMFADKAVQVRFDSDQDGDFDVKVMNVFGGETIEDQSRGEIKMASLITSFSLRDVSISSNLLNLDEPGEGLDSQNARRFAESVRKLEPRFGSIWLTTHNPSIMAELSGERQWTVVKRNGISELET